MTRAMAFYDGALLWIAEDDLADLGRDRTHLSVAGNECLVARHFAARGLRCLGIGREANADLAAARQLGEGAVLPIGDLAGGLVIESVELERLAVELLQRDE